MKEAQKEAIIERLDLGLDEDGCFCLKFEGVCDTTIIRSPTMNKAFDDKNEDHIKIFLTAFCMGFDICQDEIKDAVDEAFDIAKEMSEMDEETLH